MALVLVLVAAAGIAHIVFPDRFIPILYRRDVTAGRFQMRIVGALFTAGIV